MKSPAELGGAQKPPPLPPPSRHVSPSQISKFSGSFTTCLAMVAPQDGEASTSEFAYRGHNFGHVGVLFSRRLAP